MKKLTQRRAFLFALIFPIVIPILYGIFLANDDIFFDGSISIYCLIPHLIFVTLALRKFRNIETATPYFLRINLPKYFSMICMGYFSLAFIMFNIWRDGASSLLLHPLAIIGVIPYILFVGGIAFAASYLYIGIIQIFGFTINKLKLAA